MGRSLTPPPHNPHLLLDRFLSLYFSYPFFRWGILDRFFLYSSILEYLNVIVVTVLCGSNDHLYGDVSSSLICLPYAPRGICFPILCCIATVLSSIRSFPIITSSLPLVPYLAVLKFCLDLYNLPWICCARVRHWLNLQAPSLAHPDSDRD